MPRTPPPPPHGTVQIGDRTYPITLSQPVLDYLLDRDYTNETNIGSLNSGQNEIRTTVAQAQATANGAVSGVATLASQTAPGGFYAAASPSSALGSRIGSGVVTTNAVAVTPTGGTPGYTYAWTLESGNFTILSPTSASTTFRASVTAGETVEDIATCTVTDSLAATTSISIGVAIYGEIDGLPP